MKHVEYLERLLVNPNHSKIREVILEHKISLVNEFHKKTIFNPKW